MAGRLAAASRFRRRVLLGSRRRPAGERSVDTFVLPGLQHTSLLYVIPCRYSYPCIPLLLMRIQFGAISVCPDFRAKRQLFGVEPVPRPVTNIRIPKRKNRATPRPTLHLLFSPPSLYITSPVVMAIQKEPGQKGVNWSNIAVGMPAFFTSSDLCLTQFTCQVRS
jgi:hypothetical protein